MNDINEFLGLLRKYLKGKASPTEVVFLEKYYEYFDKEADFTDQLSEEERTALKKSMLTAIWKKSKMKKITLKHTLLVYARVAAAAVILILAGSMVYYLVSEKGIKDAVDAGQTTNTVTDIPPGGNKALLTLADGREIILDSAPDGKIADQASASVEKIENGRIRYKTNKELRTEPVFNSISTPRGGQYQLTLSDQTKVWLNSGSSIRFPVSFLGDERKIVIQGEVYLEVARDNGKPFIVEAGNARITVLGTAFNIKAYQDESSIMATLVKGVIRMNSRTDEKMISPGQQVVLYQGGELSVESNVNIGEILAWKNGLFIFNSTGVEEIMKQVSRWYDVDIEYEGKVTEETFSGVINRSSNVSRVLSIMEQAGLKFTLTSEKIKVENNNGE